MNLQLDYPIPPGARIKVLGVGGGGGNAINTMIRSGLEGVEFIAANTDLQSLRFSLAPVKIQIGKELTKGLGAGADPDIGRDAALEDRHQLMDALQDSDMVFITAGMGGGTGTGAASIIAQLARELGALTVAVVTKPFDFEGRRRLQNGLFGIERLRESVDTLITIPNQRLLQIATPNLSMVDAFAMADNVLVNAVKGISDIINVPGTVNVDFADVKTVMSCMGHALMGIGSASGENRAVLAAKQAISSPLLEDIDIEGATGILINITASHALTLMEVSEACSVIQDAAHEDANIIFGSVMDDAMEDQIRITVIATGFPLDKDESDYINNQDRRRENNRIIIPKNDIVLHKGKLAANSARQGAVSNKLISPIIPSQNLSGNSSKASDTTRHEYQAGGATAHSGDDMALSKVPLTEAHNIGKQKFSEAIEQPKKIEGEQKKEIESPVPLSSNIIKKADDTTFKPADNIEIHLAKNHDDLELNDEDDLNVAENDDRFSRNMRAREDLEDSEPRGQEDLENSFDFEFMNDEINQTIDDALKISERIRERNDPSNDDDIDIPTFIRQGIKDLKLD